MSESKVEARFWVTESTELNAGKMGKVRLTAVSRGDQNAKWSQASPAGSIELTISNMPAFETIRAWQRAGKDVSVILAPVDVLEPGDGHPFRQTEADPATAYGGEGRCGDCGYLDPAPHPQHQVKQA